MAGTFTSSLHPRGAKGTANGGKFVAKKGGGAQQKAAAGSTNRTAQQLKQFQKANGLPVTGKFDARTKAALAKAGQPKSASKKKAKGKSKRSAQTAAKRRAASRAGTATRKTSSSRTAATQKRTAAKKQTSAQRSAMLHKVDTRTSRIRARKAALRKTAKKTVTKTVGHKTVQIQNHVVRVGQGGGYIGKPTHSRTVGIHKKVLSKSALAARKTLKDLRTGKAHFTSSGAISRTPVKRKKKR